LARLAEQRLSPDQPLKIADLHQLIEQCRIAKESLLQDDAPIESTITLLGSGSQLIGKARSTVLSRDEVRRIVVDGFFPQVSLQDRPQRHRSGVVEFGLPYASDPAITSHIAEFLQKHQHSVYKALGDEAANPVPHAVLLNGGVFKSPIIANKLLSCIGAWTQQDVIHLKNQQPELAVAFGAVAYGLARQGKHLRIGGGSARSFFVVVESSEQHKQGVCVLPKGTEEGRVLLLKNRTFALQ
jgi:hypothetical protein